MSNDVNSLISTWGELLGEQGYKNIEEDINVRKLSRNATVYATVGFWNKEDNTLDGIIIKSVKFTDRSSGMKPHGYVVYAIGSAPNKITKLGFPIFSQDGRILLVEKAEKIEVNRRNYDGFEIIESMGFYNFLKNLDK